MVPPAEAWRSGAGSRTTGKRQGFANDLTRPQLIAVTDNVNQAKGVKSYWALTLQSSEKTALQGMLDTCAS